MLTAGRYIAIERGAFDGTEEVEPVEEIEPRLTREPLIRCLDAESLASVAAFCGVSLAELVERYS